MPAEPADNRPSVPMVSGATIDISVVVNTLNEEANLAACLDTVRWAAEIIVVDMQSDDRTIEIARRYTDRVFSHPRTGYVETARNFAVEQATRNWVLIVDADERIPDEVAARLPAVVTRAGAGGYAAVMLPRRNYLGSYWIKGSGWGLDLQIRLFRRGKARWTGRLHQQPEVAGPILILEPADGVYIHHYNYRNFADFVDRINRYTGIESTCLNWQGWEAAFRAAYEEFQGRYDPAADGDRSVALAALMAFYRLLSHIKAFESAAITESASPPSNADLKRLFFEAEYALMADMEGHLKAKDEHIADMMHHMKAKDEHIADMMHHMKAKDEHIADMTHNLANLAYERTRLEAELDDIQHSGWYRAARGFRLYRPRCFVTREVETPFVSIILVNYNGKHFLEDCLCSIQKQTYPANRFEIILVDNASRDGSAAFVRERFPQVQLIENKSNVGYASGNNLGFRKAKGNLIALLNNDTVVEPQWLEALVDAILLDPRVGAVSSKIYFKNRPGIINNAGLCLLPDGSGCDRGFHAPDQGQFNSPTEVFGACGAGMLMRRELFDDVGGFDDRLFMYYEDLDLAWRARIRGWRARFEPHSVVHHVHCGSSVEWSPFFLFYVERNRVLVNIKNAPAKQALRVFASFCYRALRKWALVLTWREQSERDRGHALSYLKACFSLAWGLPGALWKRLKIRYWRRITPDTAFAQLIGPNI